MKVIQTDKFKKQLRSKKLQKNHKNRIRKILNLLYLYENFEELENCSIANAIYKFERLKYSLNAYFSFRLDNKEIRLLVRPNTIIDYNKLALENEILIVEISFKHYKHLNL
ncbi:MAG: hypothetical protein QM489_04865 [Candidatus Izemoplasma sp.]